MHRCRLSTGEAELTDPSPRRSSSWTWSSSGRDELAATERERLRLAGDLVAAQDQLAAVRAENADLYAERAEKARERHALEDQLAAERTAHESIAPAAWSFSICR